MRRCHVGYCHFAFPVLVEHIVKRAIDRGVAAGKRAVTGISGRNCGGVYSHHAKVVVGCLVSSTLLVFQDFGLKMLFELEPSGAVVVWFIHPLVYVPV